jgi:hypothetical protein
MVAPLILETARYGGNCLKKQGFRHSSQLYRREKLKILHFSRVFSHPHVNGHPKQGLRGAH